MFNRLLRSSAVAVGILAASFQIPIMAQGGFAGPGRYEITNLKSGKVIDLDRNDQSTVIQFSSRGTDNQAWDVVPAPGGFFYIRNAMNGAALEAAGDRNSDPLRGAPFTGGPLQQWRITPGKDGNVVLVNRTGKVVDVPDGTGRDGARLQIYDENGDSNQRFIFRRLAGNFRGGGGRDYDRAPDRGRDQYNRDRDRDRMGRDVQSDRYLDDRDRTWKLRGDGVCFYRDRDFRGEAYCAHSGDQVPNVGPQFNDSFSSVRFFGRTRGVDVYLDQDFGGEHMRLRNDEPNLSRYRSSRGSFEDRITSFRVY